MSRRTAAWWSIILMVLVGSVLIGRVLLWRPLPVSDVVLPDRFVRVSGVAHVHTTHSDGGGTIADVQRAAAETDLDFVIVTDHNTLFGKPQEGYSKPGVLTIVGTEVSNHQGHLLAVGIPSQTYRFSGDGLDAMEDIRDSGGLAFAAHPEHSREGLRWTGWNLPGNWGLEVLNGDTQWRAASWSSLTSSILLYPLNPTYAVLRMMTRPTALTSWDHILFQRHATAIAGTDAHGPLRLPRLMSLPRPSYETLFQIARNHVLLEQPLSGRASTDIDVILDALERGRTYIGVDGLAPADRFYFVAERSGDTRIMGDIFETGSPVFLSAGGAFPVDAIITLLRNGQKIATSLAPLEVAVTEPGSYRVEVHVPGWNMPWIMSNPIYILDDATRASRALAAVVPDPLVSEAATILDAFDRDTTFETVADETSTVNAETSDPMAGPDGSAAARIGFELGIPSLDNNPSPFASLVSYSARDLSEYEGFVFSVKSDRTYRFWIQLRDPNPRAQDQTESWFASIKSTPRWRSVTLPFSRLKSLDPHTDRQLDLTHTEAIVFLVDLGGVAPGTAGTIWIDDLGVY